MNSTQNEFWSNHTDHQILEALQQYLYRKFGFKKEQLPEINDDFLEKVYYATLVFDDLIDKGWERFEKSIWNRTEFFDSFGYFSGRIEIKLKERIQYFDPFDEDSVQQTAIDTRSRLHENIAGALRTHHSEIEPILADLTTLIDENRARRLEIYKERWQD